MINPANGHIELGDAVITPEMTPDDFTTTFDDANEHSIVEQHPAYNVLREDDGRLVGVTVRFEEDQLSSASVAISQPDELELAREDDAYHERENERHAQHIDLLQSWFGYTGPYNFDWGEVAAILDPHYGNAYIAIDYNNEDAGSA